MSGHYQSPAAPPLRMYPADPHHPGTQLRYPAIPGNHTPSRYHQQGPPSSSSAATQSIQSYPPSSSNSGLKRSVTESNSSTPANARKKLKKDVSEEPAFEGLADQDDEEEEDAAYDSLPPIASSSASSSQKPKATRGSRYVSTIHTSKPSAHQEERPEAFGPGSVSVDALASSLRSFVIT